MDSEEQPEDLSIGKNYILRKDLHCFRVLTLDTKAQVFGSYSYTAAKIKFEELEAHRKN